MPVTSENVSTDSRIAESVILLLNIFSITYLRFIEGPWANAQTVAVTNLLGTR